MLMLSKMKKKIGIIIGFAIILLAFGFLGYAVIVSAMDTVAKDKTLVELSYNELEKKLNNKDTFILVITQTKCSHCAQYKPVLKEVLYEYNLKAYEIDQEKLSKKEHINFKSFDTTNKNQREISFEVIDYILEDMKKNLLEKVKKEVK